jgi:hypothetical protein
MNLIGMKNFCPGFDIYNGPDDDACSLHSSFVSCKSFCMAAETSADETLWKIMRHVDFFLTRKKKSLKPREKKLCKFSQAWGGQSSERGMAMQKYS